jgi:hypothetical protein
MEYLKTYENYGLREIIFQSKRNRNITITISVQGGRITSIDNPTNFRFPYQQGQPFNRGLETWACNNNFLMDGKDTCPEKKIFGVSAKDVPQGHEWRTIFPNKF